MVTVGTTQPATFAKTVYSGFGSKLSHPGPQLPVDGEVSKGRTIYPITRRAVSIDIERLTVQVVGGEPTFKIGCHTLRHRFAIHLLLYGRPLKFVSQLP